MGTFGELFPGRKLRSDAERDGTGERDDRGPLDLDSGVVRLGRRPSAQQRAQDDEDDEADTGQDG